ncbi:MAG: hypothetical protein J5689_03620 [Clostridia bacterium]|nr:hypothetical protein [Clostridia bacterium]
MKKNIFKVIGLVLTCILTCGLFVGCVGFDAVEDMTKDELLGKVDSIVETYKSENAKTNNEIGEIGNKLENNNTELGNIKTEVDALNQTNGEIKTEVDGVKDELTTLNGKVDALNQTNDGTKTEVNGVKSELEEINEKLAELNNIVVNQVYTKEQAKNLFLADYYAASVRLMTDTRLTVVHSGLVGLTVDSEEYVYTAIYDQENELYYYLDESNNGNHLDIISVTGQTDEYLQVESKQYSLVYNEQEEKNEVVVTTTGTNYQLNRSIIVPVYYAAALVNITQMIDILKTIELRVLEDGTRQYFLANEIIYDSEYNVDENGVLFSKGTYTFEFKNGLLTYVNAIAMNTSLPGALPYPYLDTSSVEMTFEYGLTLEDVDLTEYLGESQE